MSLKMRRRLCQETCTVCCEVDALVLKALARLVLLELLFLSSRVRAKLKSGVYLIFCLEAWPQTSVIQYPGVNVKQAVVLTNILVHAGLSSLGDFCNGTLLSNNVCNLGKMEAFLHKIGKIKLHSTVMWGVEGRRCHFPITLLKKDM